jgi:hypothetical protein
MKTRSQTKAEAAMVVQREPYEVDIDFDGASEAWHMNKKRLANGCYEYVCISNTKSGRKCCRKPNSTSDYCYVHSNIQK